METCGMQEVTNVIGNSTFKFTQWGCTSTYKSNPPEIIYLLLFGILFLAGLMYFGIKFYRNRTIHNSETITSNRGKENE